MKRLLIFSLLSTMLCSVAVAQPSNDYIPYKNEFGIDATSFIRQFLKIDASGLGVDYYPLYYITYRRLTKVGNIRAAVGGDFADRKINSSLSTDSNQYYFKSHTLNFRVGWEFVTNISKRWQTFYGADVCFGIQKSRDDVRYWNGGYAHGIEASINNYALAPLLGFRYRLNDRVSIGTETSFSFNWTEQKSRQYFTPVDASFPALSDIVSPKSVNRATRYQQPVSLFFMVNL